MNKHDEPIHLQLIQTIKRGFTVLDSAAQKEVIEFIKSKQHPNGGFVDRAENPDSYYSLFGHWLCLATSLKEQETLLKTYINDNITKESSYIVDNLAISLISLDISSSKKKYSFLFILKSLFNKNKTVNVAYHIFLLALLIDANGRNKSIYYLFIKAWLLTYNPKGNIPCSLLAALIFARFKAGLKTKKKLTSISAYKNKEGGFKAFIQADFSDMLSTGVTLFVLEKTKYDFRAIKPDCLNFVEYNYSDGAFLSGDGDSTKDLEYTFYGLLALGSLISHEE